MTEQELQSQLDPQDVFTEANRVLLAEYRQMRIQAVMKMIHAINGLTQELQTIEQTKKKKEQQLEKKKGQLEQVKKGNWAALFVKEDSGKNEEQST